MPTILYDYWKCSNYHQDAIGSGGVASKAVCYLTVTGNDQKNVYGVGVDSSIDKAAIRAVLSAINRSGLVKPQDLLSRGNV